MWEFTGKSINFGRRDGLLDIQNPQISTVRAVISLEDYQGKEPALSGKAGDQIRDSAVA
jgi:hypothetical protein